MTTTTPSTEHSAARRTVAWLLLYVFGLSITTLLVAMWGRAVAGDEATLGAGVRAAVEAQLVAERMEGWLVEAVPATGEQAMAPTLQRVMESPEVETAVDVLVASVVAGAVAEPGTVTVVDVGEALAPVARVMAEELGRVGADVSPDELADELSALEPIVLAASDGVLAGAARTAHGVLTVAAVVAALTALASGGASVALAPDRVAMARTLLFRLAVGAMTFLLFARIGAWALDPQGGRSPVAAGGSVILRSHTGLLLAIMAAGALAGTGLGAYAVRRRRQTVEDVPAADDSTEERILVTA